MSEFDITFLGTSASMPTIDRNVSGTLIRFNGQRFLVDCGEGTQRQMMKYGGLHAPDAIFLTHYHPDHTLGLPGLFASLKMAEHDKPIYVFGPRGLANVQKMCQAAGGSPSFVKWIPVHDAGGIMDFNGVKVSSFATNHGCFSQGYVFQENDKPGRFNPKRAIELGVLPGPEFGKLQRGESVEISPGVSIHPDAVVGKPRKGRKVVLTGDTAPSPDTATAAMNADVLVHEATFSSANRVRARKVKHSTALEASTVGRTAMADKLVLTHFSPREWPKQMLKELYPGMEHRTVFAEDGMTIDVPIKD